MKRKSLLIWLFTLTLFLVTGCISNRTVIKLNADGSGTFEITTTMRLDGIGNVGIGSEKASSLTIKNPFPSSNAKSKAAQYGEGVTFVSSREIRSTNVMGSQAVYAFNDVSKLSLDLRPSMPEGMNGKKENADRMSFNLSRNADGTSQLTVHLPKPKKKDETKPVEPTAKKEPTTNELAMMKKIFNGMKISLEVEPQGKIVSTTSPYVEGGNVTIMAIDFGLIVQNADKFKAFSRNKNMDYAEINKLCKDIPGMKIPPSNEIKIVFSGSKSTKAVKPKKK